MSGGIVALILNWMLLRRIGVSGVAAITVVNYTMLLGYMMYFAISDTVQVMNFAEFRRPQRRAHGRLSAHGRRHHRDAGRRFHHGAADRQRADHPAVR